MGSFNRRFFLKGSAAAAFTGVAGRLHAEPSAAVDRFIPANDLSPSATDMGVPEYIDHQLAGPYGAAARW